jgi:hypothetical protein
LTVPRSSVLWWPESGATTSTDCRPESAMLSASSAKRLKRSSRQNGLSITTRSITGYSRPSTSMRWMPNSGFS